MQEIVVDPAIGVAATVTTDRKSANAVATGASVEAVAFYQTIRLVDGPKVIGQARWQSSLDPAGGVVQILELRVAESARRLGNGRRLMEAVQGQAIKHFKLKNAKLRRMWMVIEQKRQVVGRSFVMQFGFHHVGTVPRLLEDEDLLVYMRTFD